VNVVLLHALPLDERMWEPQLDALSDFDVLTLNLYGLGGSMDEWAEGVLEQVDGPLVVVGASMGGYCALAVARRASERVEGVALVGSRVDADSSDRRAGRAETIELIRREGAAGLWRAMRPRLFPPEAPTEAVERARAIALEQDPKDLVTAVEAIRDRRDSTASARALGERLLIAVGTRDPFVTPDDARSLEGARVTVFEGAGHLPGLEQPEDLNRILNEYLSRWR